MVSWLSLLPFRESCGEEMKLPFLCIQPLHPTDLGDAISFLGWCREHRLPAQLRLLSGLHEAKGLIYIHFCFYLGKAIIFASLQKRFISTLQSCWDRVTLPMVRKTPSNRSNLPFWAAALLSLHVHVHIWLSEWGEGKRKRQVMPPLVLAQLRALIYYGYQMSKAGWMFFEKVSRSHFDVVTGNWLHFQWRLVGIDVNGCKACEIAGGDIVTIGNKESCPW